MHHFRHCNQVFDAWCAGQAQALEGVGIQPWILGWISQWLQRAPSSIPNPGPQQQLHRCASLLVVSDQKVTRLRLSVCLSVLKSLKNVWILHVQETSVKRC